MSIIDAPYIRLDETDVELYRFIRAKGPTRLTDLTRWFPHVVATTTIHRTQRMVRAGLLDASNVEGHLLLRIHPLGVDRLRQRLGPQSTLLRSLLL